MLPSYGGLGGGVRSHDLTSLEGRFGSNSLLVKICNEFWPPFWAILSNFPKSSAIPERSPA
jgi:hypothetical protein